MVYNETFDSDFYRSLSLFKVALKLRLAAGMNGGRKSNAKGSSVEFSDFREYIPGDDIRKIDWNAYARFNRLFVKLFMEEKEGIFRIFLDTSASMNYGEKNKKTLALRIAAALSYCILDSSDRVKLCTLKNSTCTSLKSTTGRQGFSSVIDNLNNIAFAGDNDLLKSLRNADIKERGMSIVISDFYTTDIEDILKLLTIKKQEIFFIHILSEEEMYPMLDGTLSLNDSETMQSLKVTGSTSLMKAYAKKKKAFLGNIESLCKKYGAKYILVSTEESFDKVLRS